MINRRILSLIGGAALTGGLVFAAPATAQASVVDVSCGPLGTSDTVTFTPGLHLFNAPTKSAGGATYSRVSLGDPTIIGGSYTSPTSGSFIASCLDPLSDNAGYFTIPWNNGKSSTGYFTVTNNVVAGEFVEAAVGTITSGEFTGDTATVDHIYSAPNELECLSPSGLTSLNGSITILLTPA
ncbi:MULTISPECIES: hypothetical protein [unclassified Streptomyces]|uniref:hypothetical protein n=1 Tax=unclassified Streptomyces TaxID=2593676 RepID=UPI0033258AB6